MAMNCHECGLPIAICNAAAIVRIAVEKYGSIEVGKHIAKELLVSDGITNNAPVVNLMNHKTTGEGE